jgi:hypothetical protein
MVFGLKECCISYSWKCSNFNKKVPPVNSEVLVDLKNIEIPVFNNVGYNLSYGALPKVSHACQGQMLC